MTNPRRIVRVKPHSHQPSKRELEDEFDIRKADGTKPTPEELARVALSQVRIVEDPDA